MPKKKKSSPIVYLVSDGTCRTCEQVAHAAGVQFDLRDVKFIKLPKTRTAKDVENAINEAAKTRSIIFYTLVMQETREAMKSLAETNLVRAVDVLGPVTAAFSTVTLNLPQTQPGLLYQMQREYIERIEAIDYTLKHDDGLRLHELDRADVVLVGVSRVSKSSTCFYLGYRSVKAANVPLIFERDISAELLELSPEKVIGLRASARRLQTVREARVESMGMGMLDNYLDERRITREMRWATRIMTQQNWRIIDVTYKAIEEVAREVMLLRGAIKRD